MLPANLLLNATAPAGPHLPTALLRQYAAGTLAPAAQHRVEAHTLVCSRCADTLAGLQQTPPATTDQALAQLQQRLRQRVQQQAAPARYDREERRNRWLIPQLAAAAALLLGLVAGGWWAWQQRHSTSVTKGLPAATVTLPAEVLSAPAPLATPAPTTSQAPAPLASSGRVSAVHPSVAAQAAKGRARRPRVLAKESNSGLVGKPAVTSAPLVAASSLPAAPVVSDSVALLGQGKALANSATRHDTAAALVRPDAMPAAPKLAPTPVGGYLALRKKLRREAAEFKPEAPAQPLSGTVQLRLTIGADGKIQQTKVVRGLREDYDAEAQRLVCDGPGWIPGISGGRRATLDIELAVPF